MYLEGEVIERVFNLNQASRPGIPPLTPLTATTKQERNIVLKKKKNMLYHLSF